MRWVVDAYMRVCLGQTYEEETYEEGGTVRVLSEPSLLSEYLCECMYLTRLVLTRYSCMQVCVCARVYVYVHMPFYMRICLFTDT